MSQHINYPYIPDGKIILYVDALNPYMTLAKEFARKHSRDSVMPGAALVVKDGVILGTGANGSDYHTQYQCNRILLGCKSGEGYELCEGCHPKNHSEASAVRDATKRGNDTNGADLYLWGHWWCCEACWNVMMQAEIVTVYLLENSEILFNKEHPENIVGRQLEQ